MPLFIGDECYYATSEACEGEKTSPIFGFNGYVRGEYTTQADYIYAPSITALMQAIAECANTHDGISANFMCYGEKPEIKEVYPNFPHIPNNGSTLSPIYDKYGVLGGRDSGLWG
jgi:hypothetical protein